MNFLTALRNIHADPFWWRKVLLGGALAFTIFGAPWSAGLVAESMDNVRKGYPTPLPPNTDWSTRYVIGLFALMIDFLFFVVPLLVGLALFFCAVVVLALGLTNGDAAQLTALMIVGLVALAYIAGMFALSIAPVGRLLYIEGGVIEPALSMRTVRRALEPQRRMVYGKARLRSLPAYVPALLLAGAAWLTSQQSFPEAWVLALVFVWLTLSALVYAHLVVAQLYGDAERQIW